MKKIIAVILSVILILPAFSVFAADGHWADPYMDYLKENNIISGDSTGNMRPDDYITRAEFAQVTNKAFGYTEKASENFADVSPEKWYADAMSIAKKKGYFAGDEKGNSNPENTITRAEAATAFARILNLDTSDVNTGFTDDASIPHWAKGAVKALKNKGIINGYSDGSYKSYANMKRAEYFTIVYKNLYEEKEETKKEESSEAYVPALSVNGSGKGNSGGGGGGGGGASAPVNVVNPPANLFFNSDNYNLSWDASINAITYDGYIERTTPGTTIQSRSFSTQTCKIELLSVIRDLMATGRTENETFTAYVRAGGMGGLSGYSSLDIRVTNLVVPLPEFALSQSFENGEKIDIIWTPSEAATSYELYADFGSGWEALTVNPENNKASLSSEQIEKISGVHQIKYSITSLNEDEYLSVSDKICELEFPLFGGIEKTGPEEYVLIYNNRHMKNLSNKALNYKLMDDITLTNVNYLEGFKGIFDGNEKTLTLPENAVNGLFKSVTADGIIKNLITDGVITASEDTVGSIVASNSGIVENCVNKATINGKGVVGGIVGDNLSGATITSCVNNGVINATGTMAGGICGQNKGKITNCGNNGTVSSNSSRVGGIAGYVQNANVYKSYNTGAIKGDGNGVSGIVGQTAGGVTISDCFNAGNIKSSNGQAGGGAVSGIDGNSVSGGDNIINCYNIGIINHTTTDLSSANGIFGVNKTTENPINYIACYYLSDNNDGKEGTVNLTEAQMKTQESFEGYDFSTIWEMGGEAYPCPVISGVPFDYELPEGTKIRPYAIKEDTDFARMNSYPEDYYTLANDITVTTYIPVATFSGNFNGNGKTITFTEEAGATNGIFVTLTTTAYVSNVIVDGKIGNENSEKTAAIAGTNNGIIENCVNKAEITGKTIIGGIAGDNKNIIRGCVNEGSVTSSGQKAGGISAQLAAGGVISRCGNKGNVTAGSTYCGGITGYMIRSNIEYCYNHGSVTGTKNVGGILGMGQAKHSISNCYNVGTITATNNSVGGIEGYISPITTEAMSITNSYNAGKVMHNTNDLSVNNALCGTALASENYLSLINCFYLSDYPADNKAGVSVDSVTTYLTENEFSDSLNFTNWDFENIWEMGSVNEKTLPVLK